MALLAAACSSQPHVIVPAYRQPLPEDVKPFFTRLRQSCPLAIDRSFAVVASNYVERDYTYDEYLNALRSLAEGVTQRDTILDAQPLRDSDVRVAEGAGEEPLIVYVNPTCGECSRVLGILLGAAGSSDIQFPPVVVRLLPGPDRESMEASTRLDSIRVSDPSEYATALLEVLNSVPEGNADIDVVLRPYSSLIAVPDSDAWHAAQQRLEADRAALAGVDIPAPFGVFRGRRVARYRGAKVPFDTFRNTDTLSLAIAAIAAADGSPVECRAQ